MKESHKISKLYSNRIITPFQKGVVTLLMLCQQNFINNKLIIEPVMYRTAN